MFKKRKKKGCNKINFSTIKTFGGVKKVLDSSKQGWLPTSSLECSDFTKSYNDVSNTEKKKVAAFGRKRKNISLFNTLDSEGESAFKENVPKANKRIWKTNNIVKKKTQKKNKNVLFNSKNLSNSATSVNFSFIKNREPMLVSITKSHSSLYGSVLNHGPEMVSEKSSPTHPTSNIQSTPFALKNNISSIKELPKLPQMSSLNSSNEEVKNITPMLDRHENINETGKTSLKLGLHSDFELFNSQSELSKVNSAPRLLNYTSVTSLNSTVLDHGPEVLIEEIIHIEKPKRQPVITGAIHSTPAVLRVAGRREQKLLACAEKLHMSESLRALDGNTLNLSHTKCDNNLEAAESPDEMPIKQLIMKKVSKRRKPKQWAKRKLKKISSNSVCKAPIWKANISTAQRMKKCNDSVVNKIMRGNRLPVVDLSKSDVFNLKSDNSANASGTIKLDRLEIHTKQSSIKQYFTVKDESCKKSICTESKQPCRIGEIKQTPKKTSEILHDVGISDNNKNHSKRTKKFKRKRPPEIIETSSDEEYCPPKKSNRITSKSRIKQLVMTSSSDENFTPTKKKKTFKIFETSSNEEDATPKKSNLDFVRSKSKKSLVIISSSDETSTPVKIKTSDFIQIISPAEEFTHSNTTGVPIPSTPLNQNELRRKIFKKIQRSRRSPCSQLFSPSIYIDKSQNNRFFGDDYKHKDFVKVKLTDVYLNNLEAKRKSLTKSCYVYLEKLSEEDLKLACGSISPSNKDIIPSKRNSKEFFTSRRSLDICQQQVIDCCESKTILDFNELINEENVQSCTKLGEGVYGEVFKCEFANEPFPLALKIVPVNGQLIINNEKQKTFQEIFPEVVCSLELCKLKETHDNNTDGFIHLHKIFCVRGEFPKKLIEAWDEYDIERESENDRPHVFGNNQMYLVFAYIDGGIDVEHFTFVNAAQAKSVVEQVALSLAVAEQELQFEHRDLHWGNVLVSTTKQSKITCILNGNEITIKSHGVKAYIIDFTLSRLTKGIFTLYQNLALDPELFAMDSSSEYQFEIYKMMKKATLDEWHLFKPVTNIYWIHYLADKFLSQVNYKKKTTKLHRSNRALLTQLKNSILAYNSCTELVNDYL